MEERGALPLVASIQSGGVGCGRALILEKAVPAEFAAMLYMD